MSTEKELSKTVGLYEEAAKDNPNVDIASLMINALANQKQNLVPQSSKKWAYLISVALPPFGILIAIKYYFFNNKDDSKTVAYTCLLLTVFTLAMVLITFTIFSPNTTNQKIPTELNIQDFSESLH